MSNMNILTALRLSASLQVYRHWNKHHFLIAQGDGITLTIARIGHAPHATEHFPDVAACIAYLEECGFPTTDYHPYYEDEQDIA